MNRKPTRLNETKLNAIIKNTVRKMLNEGTSDRALNDKWEMAKEYIGAEQMLDAIYQYMDSNQIRQIIQWLDDDYDLTYNV